MQSCAADNDADAGLDVEADSDADADAGLDAGLEHKRGAYFTVIPFSSVHSSLHTSGHSKHGFSRFFVHPGLGGDEPGDFMIMSNSKSKEHKLQIETGSPICT